MKLRIWLLIPLLLVLTLVLFATLGCGGGGGPCEWADRYEGWVTDTLWAQVDVGTDYKIAGYFLDNNNQTYPFSGDVHGNHFTITCPSLQIQCHGSFHRDHDGRYMEFEGCQYHSRACWEGVRLYLHGSPECQNKNLNLDLGQCRQTGQ